MKNSTKSLLIQASLICGSVVAPLGEQVRPLEKDRASGASEGLEPLSTGAKTGSTGAAPDSTGAFSKRYLLCRACVAG